VAEAGVSGGWHAAAWLALFAASFAAMEGVAAVTHRRVMHGWLWRWHRSHHEPRRGWFELNDLFAIAFALPAIGLVRLGLTTSPWLLPVGCGMAAYGAVYVVFHDGMVHGRFPVPRVGGRYLRRLVQAHHLHHAVRTRDGALSFGFLLAPDPRRLRTALRLRRARERASAGAG
jgi:beta-carotene 3-hydroxylase